MQLREGEVVSSFYISEFPMRSRAVDLFNLFGCVAEVVEVVISPRNNKFGKRFGFARFRGVEDERMLAVKLENIMIDDKKIYANQPRYSRNGSKGGMEASQKLKGFQRNLFNPPVARFVKESKSFADIVSEGKKEVVPGEVTSFTFSSDHEIRNRWKKAYIGEVLFSGESYNIQNHLEVEGFFSIKVHPLGANLCLLEEMDEGVIQELILEQGSLWKRWFKMIRPWQESDIDSERVVWIIVHGIPCHAWSLNFFERIAYFLGSYVCVDENTLAESNMDIARILIRVPFHF
ncbi:uncharacterized protein LOC131649579 [Vicia villosa]|uniref:uncharacterized protein LOC131649579 n=1 Tax=Vicia villosa TaxID=3911 RepID=UPI00273AD768|nr:uncharacterized protein LOC131649579 [Vicia villosa]